MKKYLLLILYVALFSSCKKTHQPEPVSVSVAHPGIYKSSNLNYLERINLKMQRKIYLKGFDLTLNADSTYHMLSCACTHAGRWRTNASKLYLQETAINWRLDTFRIHGYKGKWPEVQKEPMVFTVKDDQIYSVFLDRSIIIMDYQDETATQ